jgi:hypothetical protein
MSSSVIPISRTARIGQKAAAIPVEAILSVGEVNFLWWFIQGSIMDVDTRYALWRAWGMCERHSAAWLSIEAAFRHCHFHGPAIVYAELMAQASRAFAVTEPFAEARLARRLRSRAPCQMCSLGIGPDSQGFCPEERIDRGRDCRQLRTFMESTQAYWRAAVCGRCDGSMAAPRCRAHLLKDLEHIPSLDLRPHRALVANIAGHVARYEASFRWEQRGTDTFEDRAALLSAAGWCGGWRALLAQL